MKMIRKSIPTFKKGAITRFGERFGK